MQHAAHEGPRNQAMMWWVATSLLIVMAAILVAASKFQAEVPSLALVRAFAEAALVGGLADWFAVTALFRHPLGLPIPHTAIVPSNKSRIGRSLGQFIQTNFLSDEVIDSEVVNISGVITRWLESEDNRRAVTDRLRVFVPHLLATLEEHELRKFFDSQAEEILSGIDLAKFSAKILRLLTVDELHEAVLDEVVQQSRSFFRNNKEWFQNQIMEASPWFVPEFIDQRIFMSIVEKTESTFAAALSDRRHELRVRVHQAVEDFIVQLETSDKIAVQAEHIKQILIKNNVVRDYINSIRNGIMENIESDLQKSDSHIAQAIEKMLLGFSKTVRESPELQLRLNKIIRNLITSVVGDKGEYLVERISSTVEGWDTSTLIEKLEEQVGSDLQYIRLNGTIVGGCVGVIIFLLSDFLR